MRKQGPKYISWIYFQGSSNFLHKSLLRVDEFSTSIQYFILKFCPNVLHVEFEDSGYCIVIGNVTFYQTMYCHRKTSNGDPKKKYLA